VLVLSRKLGTSTLIGQDIRVVIVEIRPGVVKIGIEAPRNVPIVREEILDRPPNPSPIDRIDDRHSEGNDAHR